MRRIFRTRIAGCGLILMTMAILTQVAIAGTYRIEILVSDGVGITEPQQWAAALGRAGCLGIRIRSATGGERIEIRNTGTPADPDIVVVAQILSDGRLRLPDGTHPLSEAKLIVTSLEKLANPATVGRSDTTDKGNTSSKENTRNNGNGEDLASRENSGRSLNPERSTASSSTASSVAIDLCFARPVGFTTLGMSSAETLEKIVKRWERDGIRIQGITPVLQTMRDQEETQTRERERYRQTMDEIRQRQISGEVLDVQEELAKVYGESPNAVGKNGVVANLPRFDSLLVTPELERCASGSAVAYLLRCGGFAMEPDGAEMAIIPLRVPAQKDMSPHPVGRDPADSRVNSAKLASRLNDPLTVTRLEGVRPDRFLANLSKKLEIPILVDYASLRAKRIILDQRPITLPATESTYRNVISDALKPLGLRAVVWTDDAGNPFLWVTTGYVKI